jgi:acyl-CoA thioesterase I
MTRIQRGQCGATQWIRYCLLLACASSIGLFGAGCHSGEESETELSPATSRVSRTQAFEIDADAPIAPSVERPVVVFLGTSLTAGYGLREEQAFPALVQGQIDEAGLSHRVVNAGVSGDTSAGGLRRLDWLLRLPIAVLVLELGANDMLRGLKIEALEGNLDAIIDRTANSHPGARFLVAGMRAAPNLGSEYREAFDRVYPDLARRHDAQLIPFLLEGIAAKRELNQADGIHPTAEGHALIADRVWKNLEPILRAN